MKVHAIVVVTAALLAASSVAHAQGVKATEEQPGLQAKAKISADAAEKVALSHVPKGKVDSAELEKENGRFVYSVDIVVPGKTGVEEVLVDAESGNFISHRHETAAMETKEKRDEAREMAKEKNAAAEVKQP